MTSNAFEQVPSLEDPDFMCVFAHGDVRSRELLVEAIGVAKEPIGVVSITACSLLSESGTAGTPGHALLRAVELGLQARVVVLDPECAEAEVRMSVESPGVPRASSVLQSDARRALVNLDENWSPVADRLSVRQVPVGVGFNLWLTSAAARVEPYHLGQTPERRSDPTAPFQGLAHLWFGRRRPEYSLMADHFDRILSLSAPRWPKVAAEAGR